MDEHSETDGFHEDGYIVLRGLLPPALVERCRAMALANFAECNAHIGARPHPLGVGKEAGFQEIVQRQPKRYELRYGMMPEHYRVPIASTHIQPVNQSKQLEGALQELREVVLGDHVQEVIARCLTEAVAEELPVPVLDASSCLISLPGCEEQQWHSDGPHTSTECHLPCHLLSVFIPLVDTSVQPKSQPESTSPPIANTGTEIRPGSHYLTRSITTMMEEAESKGTLRPPLVPVVMPGDLFIFDYRALHRGCANPIDGNPRPVAVYTFAQPGFKDQINFPKGSSYPSSSLLSLF